MGQIADDINDGLLCDVCGVWMEDVLESVFDSSDTDLIDNPPGHPRACEDCEKED